MDRAITQARHYLDAIAVVNGIVSGQFLVDYSHEGTSCWLMNKFCWPMFSTECINSIIRANIFSACSCLRFRLASTPADPGVEITSMVTGLVWPKRHERRTA